MFGCAKSFDREVAEWKAKGRKSIYDGIAKKEVKTSPEILRLLDHAESRIGRAAWDVAMKRNGHHRINCHGCGAPHAYGVACVYCGGGA